MEKAIFKFEEMFEVMQKSEIGLEATNIDIAIPLHYAVSLLDKVTVKKHQFSNTLQQILTEYIQSWELRRQLVLFPFRASVAAHGRLQHCQFLDPQRCLTAE
jgi:hypothetical protein